MTTTLTVESVRAVVSRATEATDALIAPGVCDPPAARRCAMLIDDARTVIGMLIDDSPPGTDPADVENLRRELPVLFDANCRVLDYL